MIASAAPDAAGEARDEQRSEQAHLCTGAAGQRRARAYHIGADQAPIWVCGISIGAINAAVIAGNPPPERRLAQPEALWDFISWPALFEPSGGETLHALYNTASYTEAVTFGQPNFFPPRPINPFFAPPGGDEVLRYRAAALDAAALRRL